MDPREVLVRSSVVGVVVLLVASTAVVGTDPASQGDGRAAVGAGDVVIGENEQRLGAIRVGVDRDVEEAVFEVDLGVLETHGVDVGGAEVDLTDEDVSDASLQSATVEDGVVRVVVAPADTGFLIEEFRVTGLDTAGAEAASDVEYDVSFSAGKAQVERFDVVDPDGTTPTVSPGTLVLDEGSQHVRIEQIRSTGGDVTVEVDATALEDYGVDLVDLRADAEAEGGTVQETTARDGVVTVLVSPDPDQVLFDVRLELEGFDTGAVATDDRSIASGVTYGVSIEGDGAGRVDVEPFGVITTPVPPTHTGATAGEPNELVEQPTGVTGFGPAAALVALVAGALLVARRQG